MVSKGFDMTGKVALVTGATSGIGKEIARGLARVGCDVIIGSRDAGRGAEASAEIALDAKGSSVTALQVDMANLASVRRVASDVLQRTRRLHVLVNNAGVWATDRRESTEGHELTLATNVLGPHLLTKLLLGRMHESGAARIVNVVSSFAANYDLEDLEFKKRKWDGFKAYGQSKQALRMVTNGLAARLEGSTVSANNAAPGFVRTSFNRDARGFVAAMINFSARLIMGFARDAANA